MGLYISIFVPNSVVFHGNIFSNLWILVQCVAIWNFGITKFNYSEPKKSITFSLIRLIGEQQRVYRSITIIESRSGSSLDVFFFFIRYFLLLQNLVSIQMIGRESIGKGKEF